MDGQRGGALHQLPTHVELLSRTSALKFELRVWTWLEDIEIPFPQRDVHIRNGARVT